MASVARSGDRAGWLRSVRVTFDPMESDKPDPVREYILGAPISFNFGADWDWRDDDRRPDGQDRHRRHAENGPGIATRLRQRRIAG